MLTKSEKKELLDMLDERMREVARNIEQSGLLPNLVREHLLPMVGVRQHIEDKL
jgi:hypothetical protein